MYKLLLVTLAVFAVANADNLAGGWTDAPTTDRVLSLANWAMASLSKYTGVQGEHSVMTVRNVQTQVVAGINTKFTVDVLIRDVNGRYSFKSCQLTVLEQSWNDLKELQSATCGPHPNFQ